MPKGATLNDYYLFSTENYQGDDGSVVIGGNLGDFHNYIHYVNGVAVSQTLPGGGDTILFNPGGPNPITGSITVGSWIGSAVFENGASVAANTIEGAGAGVGGTVKGGDFDDGAAATGGSLTGNTVSGFLSVSEDSSSVSIAILTNKPGDTTAGLSVSGGNVTIGSITSGAGVQMGVGASSGTTTISTITSTNVTISLNGTANLSVSNAPFGQNSGDRFTVTVSGPDAMFDYSRSTPIGDAGLGALSLSEGASMDVGNTILGKSSGGSGSLEALDEGSHLSIGSLSLGIAGSGYLGVQRGATADVSGTLTAGQEATGHGEVNVTGSGSKLSVAGKVLLNDGFSYVENGGEFDAGSLTIGAKTGTPVVGAVMTVDNAGSTLAAVGAVVIGEAGAATLNVSDSGAFTASGQTVVLGHKAGSNGVVTLTDATKSVGGADLIIGDAGRGTLRITRGVEQVFSSITVGTKAGSNGLLSLGDSVNAGDPASKLEAIADVAIGDAGKGIATINGVATIDGGLSLGNAKTGDGTLTVKTGAELAVGDAITLGENGGMAFLGMLSGGHLEAGEDLQVGVVGHGRFDMIDGATAEIDGTLEAGVEATGTGFVSLSGQGTRLGVASGASFGVQGTGSNNVPQNGGLLTITDGAVFDAEDSDVTFGEEAGSTSRLMITGKNSMLIAASLTFGEAGKATDRADPNGGGDPLIAAPIVTAKGAIQLSGDMTLGASISGSGALNLTSGATAAVRGDLTVGESGKGTLTVDHASMTVGGDFAIAEANSGTVVVQLGGKIGGKTAATQPHALDLGDDAGGKGKLTIIDKGSSVTSLDITVGALGTGSVKVGNTGSLITKGDATIADATLAKTQSVSLDTLASWTIGGDLTAGSVGFASVSVQKGAQLDVGGDIVLGEAAEASGSVTVSGSDKSGGKTQLSSLHWGGDLVVGEQGNASLTISTGADVALEQKANGAVLIGSLAHSNGKVSVSGQGSHFAGETITIGGTEKKQGGTGSLQVTDHASASFGDAVVWRSGKVTVEGGTLAFEGDVSGNGTITIGKGGTLHLDGSDATVSIAFAAHASGQILSLESAASLKAVITGFEAGDKILVGDLSKHAKITVSATKTAATMTFKEGVHAEGILQFTGDYRHDDFHFKNGALALVKTASNSPAGFSDDLHCSPDSRHPVADHQNERHHVIDSEETSLDHALAQGYDFNLTPAHWTDCMGHNAGLTP